MDELINKLESGDPPMVKGERPILGEKPSTVFPERIGKGDGFRYNPKLVSIFLEDPIKKEDYLDPDQRDHFIRTTQSYDRVSVSLAQSEQPYSGFWYGQGYEPTCLPYSIVNAIYVLGGTFDHAFVAELLNEANDVENINKTGMNYFQAAKIMQKYPGLSIAITEAPRGLGLERTKAPSMSDIQSERRLIKDDRSLSQKFQDTKEDHKKRIVSNALLIKEHIDNGEVLLVAVSQREYVEINQMVQHAICIVGYRINKEGFMDIQVVDSARGKLWMSIEHLSDSVLFSTFVARKKEAKETDLL